MTNHDAYQPKPKHKFSFGLWTLGNRGRDPFGDFVRPVISPVEIVAMLGEVGAWGVNFHDNDLVPIDATPAERDAIVREFKKACLENKLVVPMATVSLFFHPIFRDGAFTANDPQVRAYALQKTMRAMDLGAKEGNVQVQPVAVFASITAHGVVGNIGGREIAVGKLKFLQERNVADLGMIEPKATALQAEGQTAMFVAINGKAAGIITVSDPIKVSTPEAIAQLHKLGLKIIMLTGDNERAARSVAEAAGIGEVIAGVLPAGKVAAIRRLQQAGRVVAMAGDGVNDAAALAQADLGLAMGTGTDAAIEASDLTLVRGDLLAVPDAIGLSRRTLATIKGNLFWAFGYNAAAIPLAALGFLNPLIAAAAMAFSSVFVVGNSLRLRRWRPPAGR